MAEQETFNFEVVSSTLTAPTTTMHYRKSNGDESWDGTSARHGKQLPMW